MWPIDYLGFTRAKFSSCPEQILSLHEQVEFSSPSSSAVTEALFCYSFTKKICRLQCRQGTDRKKKKKGNKLLLKGLKICFF